MHPIRSPEQTSFRRLLFDPQYYVASLTESLEVLNDYTAIQPFRETPFEHYNKHEQKLTKLPPNAIFLSNWYLDQYPEAESRGILTHYLEEENVYPNVYWQVNNWGKEQWLEVWKHKHKIKTVMINGLIGTGRTYLGDIISAHPVLGKFQCLFPMSLPAALCGSIPIITWDHSCLMFNTGKGTNHAFLGMRENKQVRRSYITIQQQLFQGKTIIVTRHPIEMMLTNWVSWKNYFTGGNIGASFSQVYSNVEDFYEDLDRNLDCFFRFYDEGILPFSTRTHEFLEQIKANKGHWNTHGDTRLDGKPKYGLNFSQTLGETAAWKSMENTIVVQFEEFWETTSFFNETLHYFGDDLEEYGEVELPRTRKNRYIEALKNLPKLKQGIFSRLKYEDKILLRYLEYQI